MYLMYPIGVPSLMRHSLIGMNGDVAQTFLVDGFVAGTWNVEQGRVRTKPFGRLSPGRRRELQDEAARLEAFVAD